MDRKPQILRTVRHWHNIKAWTETAVVVGFIVPSQTARCAYENQTNHTNHALKSAEKS